MHIANKRLEKSEEAKTSRKDACYDRIDETRLVNVKGGLMVVITFEMQKKDENSDTVHHKATRDANMCPVHAAAAIVPEFVTTKTPTTTRQSPQSSHEVEAVMSRRTYPSWDPIYLTASKT
jgi:hypothetical protein